MQTILIVIHVILAIALTGFVLVQHGKGADAGAAFGSGASSTVFGARGAASFLTRTTAILATGFIVVSLTLAILASRRAQQAPEANLGVISKEQPAAGGSSPGQANQEQTTPGQVTPEQTEQPVTPPEAGGQEGSEGQEPSAPANKDDQSDPNQKKADDIPDLPQ